MGNGAMKITYRIHSWGLASMAGNYFGEKIATHR
jgi:hypothetical protein